MTQPAPNLNDISAVVSADPALVWHRLSLHMAYETSDPRVIVEGRGMRVWDARGKAHPDAVSGRVRTVNAGCGRETSANAARDQPLRMNGFAGATNRSVPGCNNRLCLNPALIAAPDDIDQMTDAIDRALTREFG